MSLEKNLFLKKICFPFRKNLAIEKIQNSIKKNRGYFLIQEKYCKEKYKCPGQD